MDTPGIDQQKLPRKDGLCAVRERDNGGTLQNINDFQRVVPVRRRKTAEIVGYTKFDAAVRLQRDVFLACLARQMIFAWDKKLLFCST